MIVYALTDPRDGRIRYVGKSHRTARRRLRRHLAPCYLNGQTHKERWIRSLLRIGLEPGLIVLQTCHTALELSCAEIAHIARLRLSGFALKNATGGGDGGSRPHTEASKQKIRTALTGKPKSEIHRLRSALGQRGRKASEATKNLLSRIRTGRPGHIPSESTRLKLRAAKGGRAFFDQHGNKYETQNGAARALGISQAHISHVLAGARKHAGGFVFSFDPDLRVRQMPGNPNV